MNTKVKKNYIKEVEEMGKNWILIH